MAPDDLWETKERSRDCAERLFGLVTGWDLVGGQKGGIMSEQPAQKRPDHELAEDKYRRMVKTYDLWRRPTERLRRRSIAKLDLQPGQTLFDVGCGTGFSFPTLQERLQGEGRIIGIDMSPEMLARARDMADREGWENIDLVQEPIQEFGVSEPADAALFFFTHDILQTPQAVKNVIKQVKPGGRIAVGGMKFAPGRAPIRNRFIRTVASPYVTTFDGYDQPWLHLADLVPSLEVRETWWGAAYLAWGTVE